MHIHNSPVNCIQTKNQTYTSETNNLIPVVNYVYYPVPLVLFCTLLNGCTGGYYYY